MSTANLSPHEIMERGRAALLRELGPVGCVRFLQQVSSRKGDYTQDRHEWLDKLNVEDIHEMLEQRRARKR